MASPRKAKKVETPETAVTSTVTLTDVIAATQAGGFVYTSPEFHNPMIAAGHVEINAEMTDEHGNIATRAVLAPQTEIEMEDTPVTQPEQNQSAAKPVFEIKTLSEPLVKVRKTGGNRVGRKAIYPFEQLEVGQYFFVPGKNAKSLASTITSQNTAYAEAIEGETRTNRKGNVVAATRQLRKFIAVDGVETVDGAEMSGVKVARVAV